MDEERLINTLESRLVNIVESSVQRAVTRAIEGLEERLDRRIEDVVSRSIATLEEKLDKRFEAIDKRFEAIDKRFEGIERDIREIKGFQKHESDGIEFEIYSTLKNHLKFEYGTKKIIDFPIKTLSDPYTFKLISDLDAAFLISPYNYRANYSRLAERGIPAPSKKKYIAEKTNIFVLAEAKHYMNTNKIATKLSQFDRIIEMIAIAKRIDEGEDVPEGIHPSFIKFVKREPMFSQINECYLYFGAAYWHKDDMQRFNKDVHTYNDCVLIIKDADATNDKKIKAYNTIKRIEEKWYMNTDDEECVPPKRDLTDDEIVELTDIDGAIAHVEVIIPSGERFSVQENTNEPSGIVAVSVNKGGGEKEDE